MIKLLIADDETISCSSIRYIVNQHFPQIGLISEAYNGRTAVEKAVEIHPDIAILDIEMPLLNGIEAGKQIREKVPDCTILFLTAFAEFHYARQAISLGASEFLLKPIDEKELAEALKKVLVRIEKEEEPKKAEIPVPEAEKSCRFREIAMTGSVGDRTAAAVLEARKYIDSHYMDDISVESLAEQFQISANHFNRIFRQCFEIPCKEYLINIRIEKAKACLASPALTIKEAGCMVGYPDPNYFAKVFRKKTGMTPKEYRNQQFFLPDD